MPPTWSGTRHRPAHACCATRRSSASRCRPSTPCSRPALTRRPAAAAAAGGASGGALADRLARQPGHVGHRRRQPADRRRAPARGRAVAALQLRRLHRAGGGEVVRGAVRRRGEDLHLQRHRRGDHQDPHRGGSLRPLLPELRPDRPAGDGQARAADQPQLRRQSRQRLGLLPEPVVRRRGALLRALQRLHDRGGLARRPGARRHRRPRQPLRRAVGPGVRRQGRDHRRLAHRDGDGRASGPASPT